MTRFLLESRVCQCRGWLCLFILALQGCEVPPEVRVEPANPPTFTFSRGTAVDMLLVYHLKGDQAHKGILLDTLLADKENTSWMIQGEHDNQIPISYGVVPMGMKATVQAKPLIEGEYYMVYVASLVGARFLVRNGYAEQVQ
jgi:hypothetical protein